jgi:hypothetical protein
VGFVKKVCVDVIVDGLVILFRTKNRRSIKPTKTPDRLALLAFANTHALKTMDKQKFR